MTNPTRLLLLLIATILRPDPASAQTGCQFWSNACTACPSAFWNTCAAEGGAFSGQERGCGFLGCQALCNRSTGTSCGSPSSDPCLAPPVCDGGACLAYFLPVGTPCGAASTQCSNTDTCDADARCSANHRPAGTPCGSSAATECNQADSCNGAGGCSSRILPPGTSCGDPSSSECSDSDFCDLNGICQPRNHTSGFPCSTGVCDSNAGACLVPREAGFTLRGNVVDLSPELSSRFALGEPFVIEYRYPWPALDTDTLWWSGIYPSALREVFVSVGSYTARWNGGVSRIELASLPLEYYFLLLADLEGPEVAGLQPISVEAELEPVGIPPFGDGIPATPFPSVTPGSMLLLFKESPAPGLGYWVVGSMQASSFDSCPHHPNPENADSDGNGLGDACECGDQNGDGRVDVTDLVAINHAIFDPSQATPLCDTNDDGLCDVRDVIGANRRIFGAPAYCARNPGPGG